MNEGNDAINPIFAFFREPFDDLRYNADATGMERFAAAISSVPAIPEPNRRPERAGGAVAVMLDIGYFKGLPTDHILKYSAGRVSREGPGLAFFYLKYRTQVVAVPTSSADTNFVFNEVTSNFQSVTIQGQLTYRIHDPKLASSLLNFTIDPKNGRYLSNDPEKLVQRIVNIVQMETRGELQVLSLEETLQKFETIAATVQQRIAKAKLLDALGVELISVFFVSTKPTPEVGKALEAEYRETLLLKADEAIYARRAKAIAEERKIKENELNNEIALAEQRRQLIDIEGENERVEAGNRGQAAEIEAQYNARAKDLDLALYRNMDPRVLLGLALNQMGLNAERIGTLTITSEILASLMDATKNGHPQSQSHGG